MPHHEDAVARDHDVGLDGIHTHRQCELICRAGVLGPVAGRTTVPDDERSRARHRFRLSAGPAGTTASRRFKSLSQALSAATWAVSDIVEPQHSAVDPLDLGV
ncbi:hypothetical protein GCM10009776_03140 [Microbacterium deminutum]|uniref:Uncharacterized protein n=1 Tax=Microbacterium deminutum TaxID=344164 RepID=A0ABP5BGH5_9MICO